MKELSYQLRTESCQQTASISLLDRTGLQGILKNFIFNKTVTNSKNVQTFYICIFYRRKCSVYIMKKQLKINYGGKMQVYGQPVVWSQLNYEA